MISILTVIGARPQFVKAAVVSRLIRDRENKSKIKEYLIHTGQHYDDNMSAIFFREMEIPEPDINLEIGSGLHGVMTGAMLASLEKIMIERKPDLVLVYGDTNSTLAGALAASKLLIPVVHIEAGLRSFMMAMPEEQNRIITDKLSSVLFCPTETSINNLLHEGIASEPSTYPNPDKKNVILSGDVMFDASLYYRRKLENIQLLHNNKYYLVTLHRAENTDNPKRLKAIVNALNKFTEIEAVFPLHPRTKKYLSQNNLYFLDHIHVIEPVGYFKMLSLENSCEFIVTDSGGVQKEAYFFNKPCITIRDSTEWVELVKHGWNTLVNAQEQEILSALQSMPKYGDSQKLYGDGYAGNKIVHTIMNLF